MPLSIETEQEVDGRWVAEIPELPGVLAYGSTCQQAVDRAKALALRVLAECCLIAILFTAQDSASHEVSGWLT